MSLESSEFKVLVALSKGLDLTQRALAQSTGLSLGTVNSVYNRLKDEGLIETMSVTDAGLEALQPYKVQNAVIMAAGMSTRFAPLSYERPKGTLTVRGEVLIERQIRQLKEAGIDDITVVVGYMKEAFFYLEDLFGVKIKVNEEYANRNNNSTLMLVRDILDNTYICSSDDYFTENVFEPYVYEAYYAAQFFEGKTDEYCMETARDGRITGVSIGGTDACGMLGHAYFDRAFSKKFVEILEAEYDLPQTAPKLWEDIYRDHLGELRMVMRAYEPGVIFEFDSLNDLNQFDSDFVNNVDCSILDNICDRLDCSRSDVRSIEPIKEGLTNLSFKFEVDGQEYVYRHPGPKTEEIINRRSEAFSQSVAKDLGIDDTFLCQDLDEGWKISRFIPGCVSFDYHNEEHVSKAMDLVRRLHRCGVSSEWHFDLYEKAQEMIGILGQKAYPLFPDYEILNESARKIDGFVKQDGVEPCLCHNDFYAPNFLVHEQGLDLIDWEYSAMSDYASDLGVFICCSDYTEEEADRVLEVYFERPLSPEEYRHCIAYVALASYHWFIWALFKESTGNPVGEWLYLWYRLAKAYSAKAISLYESN